MTKNKIVTLKSSLVIYFVQKNCECENSHALFVATYNSDFYFLMLGRFED